LRHQSDQIRRPVVPSLRWVAWLLVWALAVSAPAGLAFAQGAGSSRFALVIGNANYRDGRVATAVNDARAMAASLRTLGFAVTAAENLGQRELAAAFNAIKQRLRPDSLAVVYYSGYAIQVARQNYLIPVDAALDSAADVSARGFGVQAIFDLLPSSTGRLVILDASRRNPMEQGFRGFSAGLALAQAPSRGFVALAASPGKTAEARKGDLSLYTSELIDVLKTPGLSLEAVFDQVRAKVVRATNGEQVPWEAAAPGLSVVLAAPAAPSPPPPAGPTAQGALPPDAFELSFWESIRESKNPADYKAYLQSFPNGRFAALARIRAGDDGAVPAAPVSPRGIDQSPAKPAAAAEQVIRDCPDCAELVVLPAGTFQMGSNEHLPFERPRHAVTISRPFAIGRREVTFDEWDACVSGGGCSYRPADRGWGRGQRPVINVSWDDAQQFIAWLSAKTGKSYRLPTEAEWEYAARAGTTTPFTWGAEVGTGRAACAGCGAVAATTTTPAGSFAPNPFGIVDMAGNAAEWVQDCWHDSYRGAPADGSAWVSAQCRERVLRGGSFSSEPTYIRSTARFKYDADVRYYANGFRVARDVP
jgi:formylglycine-generating enzyme required for sulfatase activity